MRIPDWRLYRRVVRPFLFRLPPEEAQRAADIALSWEGLWAALASSLKVNDARLESRMVRIETAEPRRLGGGLRQGLPSPAVASRSRLRIRRLSARSPLEPRHGNPRPRYGAADRRGVATERHGVPKQGTRSGRRAHRGRAQPDERYPLGAKHLRHRRQTT